ncbi:hydantoinase/oxoprolinase family protein [Mesorhizobium sp. IMUNJ 23232]|uniref:hydantoinase/oxoprolinase family protein n=1 Tax=Mesorhizobium sp. IMUNJ 23232 TaxID=3376064 RepID=UPI0037BAFAB8
MPFQACIDIGGTFTDCLVSDASGRVTLHKAPTTPGQFQKGFIDVLRVAAGDLGMGAKKFIAEIDIIVHGSTVSTNALVERKVARTGVLLNEGHEDILVLREGPRKGAFEWRLDYPEPYVSRNLTLPVRGRIDARGKEIVPFRDEDVVKAVETFRRRGVQAIAVGFLWSVVNPDHELRARDIIKREWPEVAVTLSHEINPMPREYKRIIAAAIDASISPIVRSYVEALEGALNEEGFGGQLLLANCVGGMMPVPDMIKRPIYSVMSGPTLAPMAALALTDEPDVIVGDMGGTTFDVSALRNHQIIVTPDSMIHDDSLGIPKVDVRSVGAGGGSIAFVDQGGLLHVGPRSAGAWPGPACYGNGNEDATVTDANVVLGIIDPDFFLGGRIKLDRKLAEQAVQRVADRLGVDLMRAAHAIHTTSNHNMVAAIEEITIREGINPRESYFVCGGGATSCHIAEMADILKLKRYMIPRYVAGLSAFGGLISDIRWEQNGVAPTDSRRFDPDVVNTMLDRLVADGERFLEGAGIPKERRRYEFSFMGRYEYQSWEIEVAFERDGKISAADLPRLVEDFHRMHERIYSIRADKDVVEFITWKVRAIGHRPEQNLYREFRLDAQAEAPQPKARRKLYLAEKGEVAEVPVFDGEKVGAGAKFAGPCLIETPTFTAMIKEGHFADTDEYGNFLVEVA